MEDDISMKEGKRVDNFKILFAIAKQFLGAAITLILSSVGVTLF